MEREQTLSEERTEGSVSNWNKRRDKEILRDRGNERKIREKTRFFELRNRSVYRDIDRVKRGKKFTKRISRVKHV